MFFDQSTYDVRCEWGERGVEALAAISDVVVIVDVLSFSTSVAIAVERGAVVFPFGESMDDLPDYSRETRAVVAGKDRNGPGFTLAPSSLAAIPEGTRLILPSPNGSFLTLLAAKLSPTGHILAGCLRNAKAVAMVAASIGRKIAIIPAGERWPGDRSLRPALEDLIGAGAIIAHLPGTRSPEALAARAVYQAAQTDLLASVSRCGSGRELIERGFSADIELAAALNVAGRVPQLVDSGYVGKAG